MSSHAYVYLHTHVQLVYTHRGGKPAQDDEQIPHQLILGSSPILPTACFIIQMYSSTTLALTLGEEFSPVLSLNVAMAMQGGVM